MIRRLALAAAALVAAFLPGAPAAAHPMPHSTVTLDVHDRSVSAELRLPAEDLALAAGSPPTAASSPAGGDVRRYLLAHFRPRTMAGAPWRVAIDRIEAADGEQTATGPYREWVIGASLSPPPGGDVRHFRLGYDAIVHQVVTHTVLVSVRQDWAAGRVEGDTQVGVLTVDRRTMTVPGLTVDLGPGSAGRGFLAMLRLGGTHIVEGTDHLLFLLVLLLPAALLATGRRWHGSAGGRRAVRRIGAVTLAFTAGHSAALAASALGHIELPARPVEAFIAASILIGATHAIRPLFPGREALVAGLFGLGHGMAFSFTLAELHLSTGQLALSLLGFNLGIELVQLLLVAMALPAIVLAARLPAQPVLRIGGATVAAVAAAGWLADRLGRPNPVARLADTAGSHTAVVMIALFAAGLAGTIGRRMRSAVPTA
ncbi:HupE/UreJ family protein [Actinoplanes sp. NPDC026619]|uniref:HupE/UreJ family protein n=1 Tax=Actinoplanes sp. NPDC026619 TaxID=3155798 RepID=UPI0033C38717